MTATIPRLHKSASDSVTISGVEVELERLLDVMSDADCRIILEAVGTEALTASEISDVCELSISATYRKINILAETGLLEEEIRVRRSGQHASEYTRSVDDIVISLDDGETNH